MSYQVQVLQGEGEWLASELVHETLATALTAAATIHKRGVAVLVADSDSGKSVAYLLPAYPEVTYPGPDCEAARAVIGAIRCIA